MNWKPIEQQIAAVIHADFRVSSSRSVGGGSINDAYIIADERHSFFVKLNGADCLEMFEAEAEGLRELAASQSILVPEPICLGATQGASFLVLSHLRLGNSMPGSDALLGEALAAMHRQTQDSFGWYRDNTIGSTPQINTREADWPVFWRQHRLAFQLELAGQHGYAEVPRLGDKLLPKIECFFTDYTPLPSLLHGDLWSGNYAFDDAGRPVIFDPAVYYGDRETDLAMTELFGGFSADFYAAYHGAWPLVSGYHTRKILYNLYHILNHLNLFGSGYQSQAMRMMQNLLSEAG